MINKNKKKKKKKKNMKNKWMKKIKGNHTRKNHI